MCGKGMNFEEMVINMEGVAQWMGLDQRCGTWMNEPQQV
jgi:hypothetical protein